MGAFGAALAARDGASAVGPDADRRELIVIPQAGASDGN
jgi:hypothetical protein